MAKRRSSVFSVVMRVDAIGWTRNPPRLPEAPIAVHGPSDAPTGFVYDFAIGGLDVSLDSACSLLMAMVEQEMKRQDSALNDPDFRRRCRLDFAISVPAELAIFSYVWPPEFIGLLGTLGVGLVASHYLDAAFEELEQNS
jgi:hypothetical protein